MKSRDSPVNIFPPLKIGFGVALGLRVALPPAVAADHVLRHGEKPALGLGQLNCQGLNRALSVAAVIGKQFERPDAIFAPDPAQSKEDQGHPYNYVRPLATIEPTAIAFGLPIDASIGVWNLAQQWESTKALGIVVNCSSNAFEIADPAAL
jgi:hypothetical protein